MENSLISAVTVNDVQLVKELLNRGDCELDARDSLDRNCIHIAAENGSYDVLCELLRHSDLVNSVCDYYLKGCSALHLAGGEGHVNIVDLLVKHGASVNARTTFNKRTALHEAAICGQLATVEALLQHGADVSAVDQLGRTALFFSVKHVPVLKCLLKYGCPVNHLNWRQESVLFIAVKEQLESVVKLLLDAGADINSLNNCGVCVLTKAVYYRVTSPKMIMLLLSYHPKILVEPRGGYYTLLHIVARLGRTDLIDLLILKGNVDVNVLSDSGSTAFEEACCNFKVEAAQRLLEFDCNINIRAKNIVLRHMNSRLKNEIINIMLTKHCLKLSAIKRNHSKHYESIFNKYNYNFGHLARFQETCDVEAKLLKEVYVSGGDPNRPVSCYDVLVGRMNQTLRRLRYFDTAAMQLTDVSKVPVYAAMIKCKLLTVSRRLLLNKTFINHTQLWKARSSLGFQQLPIICCDNITKHLSDIELHRLNEAISGCKTKRRKRMLNEAPSHPMTLRKRVKK